MVDINYSSKKVPKTDFQTPSTIGGGSFSFAVAVRTTPSEGLSVVGVMLSQHCIPVESVFHVSAL